MKKIGIVLAAAAAVLLLVAPASLAGKVKSPRQARVVDANGKTVGWVQSFVLFSDGAPLIVEVLFRYKSQFFTLHYNVPSRAFEGKNIDVVYEKRGCSGKPLMLANSCGRGNEELCIAFLDSERTILVIGEGATRKWKSVTYRSESNREDCLNVEAPGRIWSVMPTYVMDFKKEYRLPFRLK